MTDGGSYLAGYRSTQRAHRGRIPCGTCEEEPSFQRREEERRLLPRRPLGDADGDEPGIEALQPFLEDLRGHSAQRVVRAGDLEGDGGDGAGVDEVGGDEVLGGLVEGVAHRGGDVLAGAVGQDLADVRGVALR